MFFLRAIFSFDEFSKTTLYVHSGSICYGRSTNSLDKHHTQSFSRKVIDLEQLQNFSTHLKYLSEPSVHDHRDSKRDVVFLHGCIFL